MRGVRLVGPMLALTLCGCQESTAGKGGGPLGGAPPVVSLAYDPAAFDDLTITWTQPPQATSYRLEGRMVPQRFEVIYDGIPPDVHGVILHFNATAPEATDYEFRVTALVGSSAVVSAAATHHRGLRPPSNPTARRDTVGILLQWGNYSNAASAWVLERRVMQVDGSAGPWVELPAPFPAVDYLDTDLVGWTDGAGYAYRVTSARSAERSLPSTTFPLWAPLLAPEFQGSLPLPGGVRILFRNRSAHATFISIEHTSSAGVDQSSAVVLASTSLLEEVLDPGIYTYRIRATAPTSGYGTAMSDPVSRVVVTGLPADWGMTVTIADMLRGDAVARAPDGTFAVAGGLGGFPYGATWALAAGAASVDANARTGGSRAFLPGVAVDGGGHAHAVFADGPASWTDPVPIVHLWHDGNAWQREEIVRRVLSPGDATQVLRFAIGADGTLHASWQAGPDPAKGLEVASRVGGAWTTENVSLALGPSGQIRWMDHWLAGDVVGEPHVVVGDWDRTLKHLWRQAGAWALETVPTGDVVDVSWGDGVPTAFLASTSGLAVVYLDTTGYPADPGVHLLERGAGGWGTPVTLGSPGGTPDFAAAVTPDGARLAVAVTGTFGGLLHLREAAGISTLRFFDSSGRVTTGFGPGGKAWVLDGLWGGGSPLPTATSSLPLFEEP